ncbi:hypothetical protein D1AOALGA4SA_12490, partial [Olavius algarvensis Delta 1 endosymbiont]
MTPKAMPLSIFLVNPTNLPFTRFSLLWVQVMRGRWAPTNDYELVAHDVSNFGMARRILDVGTGPGQLIFALQRAIPYATLFGVDISPAMVAQAQKNMDASGHKSLIESMVASANALPFAEETFDRVVSTGSLHHWKAPIQALSEVYRVLKINGYALMYDLVREMPKPVCEQVRSQFGSFRLALLW